MQQQRLARLAAEQADGAAAREIRRLEVAALAAIQVWSAWTVLQAAATNKLKAASTAALVVQNGRSAAWRSLRSPRYS